LLSRPTCLCCRAGLGGEIVTAFQAGGLFLEIFTHFQLEVWSLKVGCCHGIAETAFETGIIYQKAKIR
jgi:hypothetical protein